LKPAWANSSEDLISEKTHHKKGLVEFLKVKTLSSSPSTAKKNNSESLFFELKISKTTAFHVKKYYINKFKYSKFF
jgi:hypothetical protein